MSIEKIKNNKEVFSGRSLLDAKNVKNRAYLSTPQDSVSFTGANAKATESLSDFLLKLMPKNVRGWLVRSMVKIHEGMGEFQNQLINAVGTGLVAPIFIKWNPLSDKDEDTRTYTAWRQPVSAVLAIGTQGAIVIPFNHLIRKLSDVGYLGTQYNATLFPSDAYIEKELKGENPGVKYTKSELKAAVSARKKEYETRFLNMIEQDKVVWKTTDGVTDSTLEMPKAEFKKVFEDTIDSIIKSEEQQKLNAVEKKLPNKIRRGIFYHNHPEESLSVLQKLQSKLSAVYNQSDLNAHSTNDEIINASKNFDKECKSLIKELKKEMKQDSTKKELNEELIKIVKEIKDKNTSSDPSSLRVLSAKISKMIDSVETMRTKRSTQEIIEYVTEAVTRRTSAIDGLISTLKEIKTKLNTTGITVKEAQAIIDETIRSGYAEIRAKHLAKGLPESEIANSIEWIESPATRLSEKVKSIPKCIAEQMKKIVKSNIDGMKRWTGLGVSLAILPFTCWLLNKIYPWFMDKAFPELSNKAASAKKDKYNKTEEVK